MPKARRRNPRGNERGLPVLNKREADFIADHYDKITPIIKELQNITYTRNKMQGMKLVTEILTLGFKIGEQYVFRYHSGMIDDLPDSRQPE